MSKKARLQRNHLERLMIQAGFETQRQLARHLQITPAQMNDWFRKFPHITEKNKIRLANALKVNVPDLYMEQSVKMVNKAGG